MGKKLKVKGNIARRGDELVAYHEPIEKLSDKKNTESILSQAISVQHLA